jgi:hypothetical protein
MDGDAGGAGPRTPSNSSQSVTVYLSGLEALRGLVFFQVGTAFVVPTDGQVYDPTDGAVVVPRQ